jgi:hypothetical protein
MTLRDDLLPVLSAVRAIPDALGLRQYQVFLRVTSWSGVRVGIDVPTSVETELTVDGARPKVRLLKTQEIISGGGKYADGDYRVGPFTPKYSTGGYLASDLDPLPVTGAKREVTYHIVGNGLDTYATKVDGHFDANLHYLLTLRLQNTKPQ